MASFSEQFMTFFKVGGHNHDGENSSPIDISRYSEREFAAIQQRVVQAINIPITNSFPSGVVIGETRIFDSVPPPTNLQLTTGENFVNYEQVWVNATWDEPLSEDATEEIDNNTFDPDNFLQNADQAIEYEAVIYPTGNPSNEIVQRTKRTYVSFEPLQPTTNYTVEVRSVNQIGIKSIEITDTIVSSVDTVPPAQTVGLSMTSGYRTALLTWTPAVEADVINSRGYYDIEFDTVNTFNSGNLRQEENSGTIIAFSDLITGTPYYARVRAVDSSGNAGPWSATVTTTPGTISGAELGDGSAPSSSPTPTVLPHFRSFFVSWDPIANNDTVTYEVHMSTSNGFTANASTLIGEIQGTFFKIDAEADQTDIEYDTTYYVKTIAKDIDGAAAASAQGSGIVNRITSGDTDDSIAGSDGTPPSSSPTPTVVGGPNYLLAEWAPVTNVDIVTYEVHASVTTGFTPSGATLVGETAGTFYFISVDGAGSPLAYGTTYYVKLIAKDDDGSAAAGAQGSGAMDKIQTVDLEDLAINEAKLAANAVTLAKLADNSVSTSKLVDDAITTVKIATDAITNNEIANDAVDTTNIVNDAITTAKIGADAVTTTEIVNDAIVAAKLAANSVTAAKISSGTYGDSLNLNPRMSQGLESYTFGDVAKWTALRVTDDSPYPGTANETDIIRMTNTAGQNNHGVLTSKVPINLEKTYLLTMWIRCPSGLNDNRYYLEARVSPNSNNGGHGHYGFSLIQIPTTWTKYQYTLGPDGVSGITSKGWQIADGWNPEAQFFDFGLLGPYNATDASTLEIAEMSIQEVMTSNFIGNNAISTDKVVNDAITSAKIGDNAVTTAKIIDDAITNAKVATGAINTAELVDSAITNVKIATDAVSAIKIQDGAILTAKLDANAVTLAKLADNAVSTAKIVDGAISTVKVATDAITNAKLADNAVQTENIVNAAITNAKIGTNAVDTANIIDSAIASSKIATGAVLEAKLADNAVTLNKLAADSVNTSKLVDAAITEVKIATDAVTTAKISDGAVLASKLVAGAVVPGALVEVYDNRTAVGGTGTWAADQAALDNIFDVAQHVGTVAVDNINYTQIDGWSTISDGPLGMTDNYATRWVTELDVVSGEVGAWDFYVDSDDSSDLYIDGTLVASHYGGHAGTAPSTANPGYGSVSLGQGRRLIEFRQVEGAGGGDATLHYRNPTMIAAASGPADGWVVLGAGTDDIYRRGNPPQYGITATEIADDAVTTPKLIAGAVTTDKITAGAVTANEIAAGTITGNKIAAGTITASNIATDTITASQIAANAITASEINAGAVTTAKIAAGAVTANEIAAATITGAKIAAGTITASNIATDTITANQIAANAITSSEILAGAITTAKIAAGAVTANEIAANTITASQIAANTLTAGEIAANAITSSELAAGSVVAGKIAAGTIVAADIAASTITGAEIAADTITAGNIAANAITTSELNALAVTAAKIATGTITATQIATDTITAANIAAGAIATSELAAGAVTAVKIAANTITANEIASNAITSDEILAGAITTAKIAAGAVTANEIAAQTITASKIAASTITGNEIAANTLTANKLLVTVGGENLAPNSTFKDDLTGWSQYSNAGGPQPTSFARVATGGVDGGAFLRVEWTGAQTSTKGTSYSGNNRPEWIPNQTYVVSFWAKTSGSGATGMNLAWNTAPSTTTVLSNPVPSSTWQRWAFRIVWGASVEANQRLYITVTGPHTTDIDIDHIQIEQGDVPSDWKPRASELLPGVIQASHLSAGSVTAASIAAGTITATELATDSVTAVKILAGAITTAKIAAGAVTANEIAATTITAAKIASGTITATQIAANTLTANEIAANAITSSELAANSVIAGKIAAGTIVAADIAAGTITATQIATDTITASQIAANAITASEINAGAVTTAKIATGAVTANEIAANTITAAKIAANTITASEIATNTLTANEIAANAITSSELAANSVIAGKIAAGTIVANDIAASTITGAKIAGTTITASNIVSGTITATQIAASTITATQIAASTITGAKIAGTTITASNIASGTITATQIATGTITADQIAASTITSGKIAVGAITALNIATDAVNANKILAGAVTTVKLDADSVTAAKLSAMNIESGKYIRSTTYTPGSAGWSIDAAGSAEFNDVLVRGKVSSSLFDGFKGSNLLANGSFDVNASNWTTSNASLTRLTDFPQAGAGYGALNNNSGATNTISMTSATMTGIVAGYWYEVSGYAAVKSTSTARYLDVKIQWYTSGDVLIGTDTVVNDYLVPYTNSVWRSVIPANATKAPATAAKAKVVFEYPSVTNGHEYHFDTLSFNTTPVYEGISKGAIIFEDPNGVNPSHSVMNFNAEHGSSWRHFTNLSTEVLPGAIEFGAWPTPTLDRVDWLRIGTAAQNVGNYSAGIELYSNQPDGSALSEVLFVADKTTFGQNSVGDVLINGNTTLTNGATASGQIFSTVTSGLSASSAATDPILIGVASGPNMGFARNEIMVRNNGALAAMHLQHDGEMLVVNGGTTGGCYVERWQGNSAYAAFGHQSFNTSSGYMCMQESTGETFLNGVLSAGGVHIRTNNSDAITIQQLTTALNDLKIDTQASGSATGSGTDLHVTSGFGYTHRLVRNTSTIDGKKEVESFDSHFNSDVLYDIPIRSYKSAWSWDDILNGNDDPSEAIPGVVAEEVATLEPSLVAKVIHDGKVEGIIWSRVTTFLLDAMQKLEGRVRELEGKPKRKAKKVDMTTHVPLSEAVEYVMALDALNATEEDIQFRKDLVDLDEARKSLERLANKPPIIEEEVKFKNRDPNWKTKPLGGIIE